MSRPQPPSQDEERNDKKCKWVYDDDEDRHCDAWHTSTSPYCITHAEGGASLRKRAEINKKAAKEVEQRLESTHYSLKTVGDVQAMLEDVVNGIMKGAVKKDKAGPLGVFLPLAYNIAKHQEGSILNDRSTIKLSVTERTKSMVMNLSDADMDAYVTGDESVKTALIEKLKESGHVVETARPESNSIDVESTSIDPEDIKVNARALAKISKGTDIPLTAQQAKDMFGANLATENDPDRPPSPTFDATGFGELFTLDGLPEGAVVLHHRFVGKFEVIPGNKAELWYTCKWCGYRTANKVKHKNDTCEKAQND